MGFVLIEEDEGDRLITRPDKTNRMNERRADNAGDARQ